MSYEVIQPDAQVEVKVSGDPVAIIAFFGSGAAGVEVAAALLDTSYIPFVSEILKEATSAFIGAEWTPRVEVAADNVGVRENGDEEFPF